ncbi:hypothetical protein ACTG2T_18890 [Aeromonas sp. 75A]|uniref:hypothetical protein n=1 Tax=unclassified Aeromonas TaxID=257493 RepID=UPI002E7AC7B0|nr:hypothetical protein [Aeromonas sp. 43P]MEE1952932.1 hypothetical protein [Aeromonas sp. 43P]
MAEQCECKNRKKMSTREWVMVCVLIVLIQLLLHYWTTESMNSGEVLAYVSFAGTIVSIILAVLAIIYSFVQTQSQQATSESISREIFRLTDITTHIDATSKDVTHVVTQLPIVLEKFSSLPDIVSGEVKSMMSDISLSNKTLHEKTDLLKSEIMGKLERVNEVSQETKILTHDEDLPYFTKIIYDVPAFVLASYLLFTKSNHVELSERAFETLPAEHANTIVYLLYKADAMNESYYMLSALKKYETGGYIFNDDEQRKEITGMVKKLYCVYADRLESIVNVNHFDEQVVKYLLSLFKEAGYNAKNVKVEWGIE